MEKNKIILKLTEEHNKLVNQLENSKSPLMTEIIIHFTNKVRAIDYVLDLLKIDNVDLDNERTKLLEHLKAGSLQGMPVDIIQLVSRLQVLFYTNELFQMEDKDDTSN